MSWSSPGETADRVRMVCHVFFGFLGRLGGPKECSHDADKRRSAQPTSHFTHDRAGRPRRTLIITNLFFFVCIRVSLRGGTRLVAKVWQLRT